MKRVVAVLGLFVLFIITIGTLFKVMYWPGASPMLIVGLGILSTFYIPLFFISRIIDTKAIIVKVANIFGLISLSILFLGMLFKIMHWPGASPMLIVGAGIFVMPTSILFVIAAFKEKRTLEDTVKGVLLSAFVALWVILFAMSKTSTGTVSKILFLDEELITALSSIQYENESLRVQLQNNKNLTATELEIIKSLHHKQELISAQINSIEEALTFQAGGNNMPKKGHWGVPGIKDSDAPRRIILGSRMGKDLRKMVQKYDKSYLQAVQLCQNKGIKIDSTPIINRTHPNFANTNNPWEINHFDYSPTFLAYPTLTAIQIQVISSENQILSALTR